MARKANTNKPLVKLDLLSNASQLMSSREIQTIQIQRHNTKIQKWGPSRHPSCFYNRQYLPKENGEKQDT